MHKSKRQNTHISKNQIETVQDTFFSGFFSKVSNTHNNQLKMVYVGKKAQFDVHHPGCGGLQWKVPYANGPVQKRRGPLADGWFMPPCAGQFVLGCAPTPRGPGQSSSTGGRCVVPSTAQVYTEEGLGLRSREKTGTYGWEAEDLHH